MLKRSFDLVVSGIALVLLLLPLIIVAIAVRATSAGPVLYWSRRVGRNNEIFFMPKFRTMRVDTPVVATHLLIDPDQYLTPIGGALRKTSLDEMPQLWSILCGHMSLVGPRPALFNQTDLIKARTLAHVHSLQPGLTGWAQINGRDELSVQQKVEYDREYLLRRSFRFDFVILCRTFAAVLRSDGISH